MHHFIFHHNNSSPCYTFWKAFTMRMNNWAGNKVENVAFRSYGVPSFEYNSKLNSEQQLFLALLIGGKSGIFAKKLQI